MGCHTWFKKQSKYSLEDLRTIWCKKQTRYIKYWQKVVSNINHKDRVKGGLLNEERDPRYTQEFLEYLLKLYQRQYRMVKNRNIKYSFIYHLWKTDEGTQYEYEKDVLYVDDDNLPHDIFRRNYTEDKLFSLEETLRYLEDHDSEIYYSSTIFDETPREVLKKKAIEDLKKFWQENPVGMIDFG